MTALRFFFLFFLTIPNRFLFVSFAKITTFYKLFGIEEKLTLHKQMKSCSVLLIVQVMF